MNDVTDQNNLLAYLSWRSKSTRSASEFQLEETFLKAIKGGISDFTKIENSTCSNVAVGQLSDVPSEIQSQTLSETKNDIYTELTAYAKFIIAKVEDMWPLIQAGYIVEVLRTLR